MLILPEKNAPASDDSDLLDAVLADPLLQQANQQFLSINQDALAPPEIPTLCVFQGEEATCDWKAQEGLVVGSEDATTCIICVLRCPVTRRVYVAHHDGATCRADHEELLSHLALFEQPEAYLVGGFMEGSGVSEDTCRALLTALHAGTAMRIKLHLACIWSANYDQHSKGPRARNLSLDCTSGQPSPAGFGDRGPALGRRFAYQHCAQQPARLVKVAHHDAPGILVLPGFSVKNLASWHVMGLERMLRVPDDLFLQYNSTSPAHEGPNFIADIRRAHTFIIEGQAQQDPAAASFKWQDGVWQLVKDKVPADAAVS